MNNLKRVLSTVLAGTMLAGMMVVGASAASFPDADKIEHTEAVNTLTALNVISGKENGNYDPEGSLTRAEMAKLAVFILHGGKDPVLGTKATPSYTDIKGNWAESYIEYCSATGIINGMGDGTFGPSATLTGSQAAKMLMVAMGYNAEVFGFTGADWEINTNIEANKIGLYKDLETMDPSVTITRDQAAQLVYNALFAGTMTKTYNHNIATGAVSNGYTFNNTPTDTLFSKKFGGVKEYGYITNVDWDPIKGQYDYTVASTGFTMSADADAPYSGAATIHSEADYSSLYGQKVAIVYKDAKTVYGIYSAASVLANGVAGNITDIAGNAPSAEAADDKIIIGDTTVKLEAASNTTHVYAFNNTANTSTIDAIAGGTVANVSNVYNTVVAIDNNGNGKADTFVTYPATVEKVSYVGASSITADAKSYAYSKDNDNYANSGISYTFYEGVAKNDYVLVPGAGVDGAAREITKVEMIEGEVAAAKTASVQVDGTWYNKNGKTITLGSTYKLWTVNDYVVGTSLVTAASKDIAMVIVGETSTALTGIKAKLLFADGTTEVVEITSVNGAPVTSGKTLSGNYSIANYSLVTYSKNTNGTYTVKALSDSNKAGYGTFYPTKDNDYTVANSATNTPAKVAGYPVADDGVFFVVYNTAGTAKYTVVSGTTLKTYTAVANGTNGNLLTKSVNGIETAAVGVIQTSVTSFGTTSTYGYVTSVPYETVESGTHYWNYTVWTKDGSVDVKDTVNNSLNKGSVISFINNTNGTVTSTDIGGTEVAIIGYNAEDKVLTAVDTDGAYAGAGAVTSIQDKTTILYVNTKDHVGIEGGEIAVAQETGVGGYISNAKIYYSGDLKLIVVDTNNNYGDSVADVYGYTVTIPTAAGAITGDTLTGATVTWSVDGIAIPANTTAYAVAGQAVVATVTMSDTTVSLTTGATLKGATTNTVAPTAKVVTSPKYFNGTTAVALNGTTEKCAAATDTVTFTTGTANKVGSGVFTFTWILVDENIAPTVVYDAAP